ncbi:universal stress protein [Streptomyces lunaelactis]|nr:universal stress protein [Streptomyces lunaelactis]
MRRARAPLSKAEDGEPGKIGRTGHNLDGVTEQQPRQQPHPFERGTDGPKVIVAGLDGSDSSLRAVSYAGGLARRQNALLAIVYVQPVMAAGAALGVPVGNTTGEIAEGLVAELRAAAERVKGIWEVRWEFHTFRGDPYSGLVTAADELKADAVVVGASESAGHRFIGSVAVRLVKAGRWPVTVVP